MKINNIRPVVISATLLAFSFISSNSSQAQSFYVDVTNSTPNPQFHLLDEGDYAEHPSYDYSGAGFSAGSTEFSPPGQGTYYIADGFLSGYTTEGLWESSWLDVLHGTADVPPHGGLGTVDILAPGGIGGSSIGEDEAIMANGLVAAPLGSGDTNGQYLGIGGNGSSPGSEYAVWATSFTVAATTTFQYGYSWTPAGATYADGTELFPAGFVGMGGQFFIDTDTDYSNGIVFSEDSILQNYMGAGNQLWFTQTGTFTLDPGTYYWGVASTGNGPASYIGIEGISMAPVPEPASVLFAGFAGALAFIRRRRTA